MPSRLTLPVRTALRVGAAAAVMAAAALVLPRAASADQQSSVRAQIVALRGRLAATGAEVHRLTSGYGAAEAEARSVDQQVAVDRVQAERAAAGVAQSGHALRQDLVAAYMGGFSQPSASSAPAAVGGDVANPSVRYGYLSIATSTMRDSLDSYRTAEVELSSTLATLAAEQRSARASASRADQARQAALDEAKAATARLGGLEAQLTALEDKAAAQRAAADHGTTSSGARAGAPAQGSPVNGGLVSLVRAQVQAVASALPSSAGAAAAALPPAPTPTVTVPTVTAPRAVTVPAVTAPPVTAPPPTTPPVTAPPAPAPAAPTTTAPSGSGDVWLQLRECESGDDYQANTGNGFYGAYQFSQQTWTDLGYPGRPDQEPAAMQDQAAQQLQAQSGWGQWPACSAALGLS